MVDGVLGTRACASCAGQLGFSLVQSCRELQFEQCCCDNPDIVMISRTCWSKDLTTVVAPSSESPEHTARTHAPRGGGIRQRGKDAHAGIYIGKYSTAPFNTNAVRIEPYSSALVVTGRTRR